jgi:hypothetical protein
MMAAAARILKMLFGAIQVVGFSNSFYHDFQIKAAKSKMRGASTGGERKCTALPS